MENQSFIISEQSKTIYELFMLLGNYMSQEELDNLAAVKRINTLAELGDD